MTDGAARGSMYRDLQTLFTVGTVAGISDGSLLERFVGRRDEAAFEEILSRHGPMVLGVCRRVLHEPNDIEDAFQATFLILVRKAATLRDGERLSPWLYGVAYRVAGRVRAQVVRRRSRERPEVEEPASKANADAERRELVALLDDEVSRLPKNDRDVLVLCDVQGRTHDAAARQLAWPLGTVKSRLARARSRLRERLIRRGLAPSAGALAAGLASESATAAVPVGLFDSTVKAALRGVAGRASVAGAVSASVSNLTEGVLTTMFVSQLKTIGAILLAVGICAAGVGVLAQQPSGNKEDRHIEALERQIQLFKAVRESNRLHRELQNETAAHLESLGAEIERDVVSINLVATKVTDDDLKSLSAFPNLQTVHLHHTSIGDVGLANLKGLRALTELDIFDTQVSDAGLEHLAEWMPHLERIELSDTQVTDTGLKSLQGLRHLRKLNVTKTKATDSGVEELKRALPLLEIRH